MQLTKLRPFHWIVFQKNSLRYMAKIGDEHLDWGSQDGGGSCDISFSVLRHAAQQKLQSKN